MPGERTRTVSGTGPLSGTLHRVSGAGEGRIDLSAHLGVPDGPGWVPAANIAGNYELLEEMMSRIERGCGLENRAYAGTSLLRIYLWRILTPAVAAFLTERRLPDLRVENVMIRFGESGYAEDVIFVGPRFAALPDDPEAGHSDAVVLPSEDEILARMRAALSETHLPALIPALRELRVRRGTRVLWRAAADVCAEAFLFVGRDLGREAEAREFAGKLLDNPSPLSGPANFIVLEHAGGSEASRVRNTCCLYYKIGNGACFTCPRTTDEERLRRLAEARTG